MALSPLGTGKPTVQHEKEKQLLHGCVPPCISKQGEKTLRNFKEDLGTNKIKSCLLGDHMATHAVLSFTSAGVNKG